MSLRDEKQETLPNATSTVFPEQGSITRRRRIPLYVYLILLVSMVLTGFLFWSLYVLLYPYLAIVSSVGNAGAGESTGPPLPPPALLSVAVSTLAAFFTSRSGLALFYTILLTSTFVSELSHFPLALYHSWIDKQRGRVPVTRFPSICVVVPAHNEEKTIETTMKTLLDQSYPNKEIVIVNDGSTDTTEAVVVPYTTSGQVTLINRPKGGKAVAINTGIAATRAEIIVVVDADSAVQRDALMRIAAHFQEDEVMAVSGNVKVGNRVNLVTKLQSLEYIRGINLRRRAFDVLDSELVVPGAVGAFRRSVYGEVGTMDIETVVEDMDQTVKMGKAGHDIHYDPLVIAFTEAPQTWRGLARQRWRWYGGTLQALLKHRHRWWKFGPLSIIGFPYLIINMFFIPAVELVALTLLLVYIYQGLFIGVLLAAVAVLSIEMVLSSIAVYLDREDWRLILYTPIYAFAYRYVSDLVRFKAYLDVYRGKVGWVRVQRHGGLSGKIGKTTRLPPA
jgi:cellulose synthase/poly-beta-1,6-N-acetylglucosamine synthase-like glycosyltransferase